MQPDPACKSAFERSVELKSQCLMWCMATGNKPLTVGAGFERSVLLMAVHQYGRGFAELNSRQRCIIAGIADY